jgi:hypothetical protein
MMMEINKRNYYGFSALVLLISALMISAVAMSGCDRMRSTIKIGYSEISSPSSKELSYQTFTGVTGAQVGLEQGDTLLLDYDAEVTKGELKLEIQNPDQEIVWDTTLEETSNSLIQYQARQNGSYTILIEGDDTGGSLDISWEVE